MRALLASIALVFVLGLLAMLTACGGGGDSTTNVYTDEESPWITPAPQALPHPKPAVDETAPSPVCHASTTGQTQGKPCKD